jgi:hypothetical protein
MKDLTLDDKYTATAGRVYLSGAQALVRLPLMQRQRDQAIGLNTAGFISGYRGSPLGVYDLALWQAERFLREHHVHFQPGVNEDLAATAVWGSQQVKDIGESPWDGVFALWYGKGPGVDRSGDPLKHGNYAGSSRHGGVLALCGDDHGARSSTIAHQSDHALIHFGMPILFPATIQEYLDLGLHGFALSRYAGCWVGFKCVTDVVEGSASVAVDPARVRIVEPRDFTLPAGGLNLKLGMFPLAAEAQVLARLEAAKAYVRANGLDRVIWPKARTRLGIVSAGKAWLDVMDALAQLGIDETRAAELGVAVYKVAMVWPLEPAGIADFAAGCEQLLVIEEKRPVIEEQIAGLLFNQPPGWRPRLTGKRDADGAPLVPSGGELNPLLLARLIGAQLLRREPDAALAARLAALEPPAAVGGFAGGTGRADAPAELLRGLPAQHLDARARGLDGVRRHRLPRAGDLAARAQHADALPHGRRGRGVDRAGALHDARARVPEPRRRHLFPFRAARDPRQCRRRHQHHLQDPRERRDLDDRRPAHRGRELRRRHHRAARGATTACRGREAHRAGHRGPRAPPRAREVSRDHHLPPPRRARCGAARTARAPRRLGHRLRTGLRHRAQAPAQARQVSRRRQALPDQRGSLRGLRRLRPAVELHRAGTQRDPLRAQAHDQPVGVQQGLLLREGHVPELRHGLRRAPARDGRRRGAGHRRVAVRGAARTRHPRQGRGLQHPRRRHRRQRHHHAGRAARDRRAHGGQAGQRARHHRAGAAQRPP